jgi:AraC-like DNA-binding protein
MRGVRTECKMAIVYATRGVHPRDRISYWVDVATKAFVRHTFTSLNGPSYMGDIRLGALDGLGVSAFACDPCEVVRSPSDIARADSDDVLLCLQRSGKGIFAQNGRQAVNEKGSFLLIDSRRPFSITFPERTRSITFKVPRRGLEARVGSLSGLTALPITADAAVGGLVSGFLSMLPSRVDALEGAVCSKLAEQALDLVALAVSEQLGQAGPTLSSARSTALFRLKSVIETHLREPGLRPAAAAAAAGISVRYANDLLSQEGTSTERYIQHRRLERCRLALEDPAQACRMIGEIAFSWGFSDLSHFGRRFRAAYGLTPGDYRRRRQEATVGGAVAMQISTPK